MGTSGRSKQRQQPTDCTMGGGGKGKGKGKGSGEGKGKGRWEDEGPPDAVVEAGKFMHQCEGDMVIKSSLEKIPYFNAPIYLENKEKIGKIDEILGSITNVMFSVKTDGGVQASSYQDGDKVYINPMKLLPLERFLPQPKGAISKSGGKGKGKGKGKGGSKGKGKGKGGSKGKGKGKGSSFGGGRGY